MSERLQYDGGMAFAGAGAANEDAAIANAIKASGVLVRVEPQEFVKIPARANPPLVVISEGGLLSTNFRYLMSYKGLAFLTKSDDMLALPADAEVVRARGINMPRRLPEAVLAVGIQVFIGCA